MISILIPVFNANVQSLVQELSNQLDSLHVEAEILVYDDDSDPSYKSGNKAIASLSKVTYKELGQNIGRISIRKLLAKDAHYNWLLFIDSDSAIINKKYIQNYLLAIKGLYDVYTGGRIYQAEEPVDCNKRLHWKYGTERESLHGSKNVFHSNNFCIQKDVFLELNFPAELKGYGHEDTWMELALIKNQKKIKFIENPVRHEGLENTSEFLEKTKNALKNLLLLSEILDEKELRKKVRLYNLFYLQKKLGLRRLFISVLNGRINRIEEMLHSCNPSLVNFDWYRLFQLMQLSKALKK